MLYLDPSVFQFNHLIKIYIIESQCQLGQWQLLDHKYNRAPDNVLILIFIMPISSPNPMFDHLLESSHRDDSNKWPNTGFGEEITLVVTIEVNSTHLIWNFVINLSKQ